AAIAPTTGRISPYGTEAAKMRRAVKRRRRRVRGSAVPAASAVRSVVTCLLRLGLIQDRGDVVAGGGGRLLDRQLAREDLGEHVAEDVPVLDVDPVLRGRHEAAARGRPLVDAGAEQVAGVRDVALRLQGLLRRRVGEVLDPVGRERL